jgi:hypothetical protein
MLPAFHEIEEEAKVVYQEWWEAFISALGTGDEDFASLSEAAEQAGVA